MRFPCITEAPQRVQTMAGGLVLSVCAWCWCLLTVFFKISSYMMLFITFQSKHPATTNGNEIFRQAFTVNFMVIFFSDNDFLRNECWYDTHSQIHAYAHMNTGSYPHSHTLICKNKIHTIALRNVSDTLSGE